MNKFNYLGLKTGVILALGFVFISSLVYSSMGNRYRSTNVADSASQPPSSNMPAIPNNMMPARNPMQGADASNKQDQSDLTIVEILSNDSSFSNLNKALASTGLLDTLSEPGPFTLFAPNDQAFAKLSPNALADLMNPNNNEKLTAILNYHIVPGKITEDRLKNMKIRTLQGKPLDIKVEGDKQTVNHAKIVRGQSEASNGVIYVIDTVLSP
jgi:uncharacterized surface protein with fasciclin (FAS1) repeats